MNLIPSQQTLQVDIAGERQAENTFSKDIEWDDSQYKIIDARLYVKARQTVSSGAKLEVFVNDVSAGSIEWHAFETHTKGKTFKINLHLGDNEVTFRYTVSGFHILQGAECYLEDSNFDLLFERVGTITGPTDPDPATTDDTIDRSKIKTTLGTISASISSNLLKIVIAGVVIIATLVVVDKVVLKRAGGIVRFIRGRRSI